MSWTATVFLAYQGLSKEPNNKQAHGYYKAMCMAASALISGEYRV